MRQYFIFGLNIRSEFPLPELEEAGSGADLVIRQDAVAPRAGLGMASLEEPRVSTTLRESHLDLGEWGRFLVREGREIIIDPRGVAEARTLGFFILERLLVLALYQRGLLVFHSSAIAINNEAVAFLGEPGAGKTGLTLAFQRDGGQLIDDDILALDPVCEGQLWVRPGLPLVKLWPDLVRPFALERSGLVLQFPGQNKLVWPLRSGFLSMARPLRRLYLLERGSALALEPLVKSEAARLLLPHWYGLLYRREMFDSQDAYARALAQSVQLSRSVPLARLTVPRDFNWLSDLKKLILDDLESA